MSSFRNSQNTLGPLIHIFFRKKGEGRRQEKCVNWGFLYQGIGKTSFSVCLLSPVKLMKRMPSLAIFKKKNWSIVDLQCLVNLCYTAKWFSYTHIHTQEKNVTWYRTQWKYPKIYCIWKNNKSQDYVYHDPSYTFLRRYWTLRHLCEQMERTGPFAEVNHS